MSTITQQANQWRGPQEFYGGPDHAGWRMQNLTTAERDALSDPDSSAAPKPGQVIFNTTTSTFQGWNGSTWVDFSAPAAADVTFVPGETGLSATDVQAAIEEIVALVNA